MKNKKAKEDINDDKVAYLDNKTKKKWVDEKSGKTCFMLYPRSLYITWSWGDQGNWKWDCYKETSDDNIEVVKLSHVCWLDVRGRLKISDLSPETVYEILYEVKLTNKASGWELPITIRLLVPDGTVKNRQIILFGKPRGEWIRLHVGEFKTDQSNGDAEVEFHLLEHGGHWKTGLLIRCVIIRPKI